MNPFFTNTNAMIIAANKSDKNPFISNQLILDNYKDTVVFVSAKEGQNIDLLKKKITFTL